MVLGGRDVGLGLFQPLAAAQIAEMPQKVTLLPIRIQG